MRNTDTRLIAPGFSEAPGSPKQYGLIFNPFLLLIFQLSTSPQESRRRCLNRPGCPDLRVGFSPGPCRPHHLVVVTSSPGWTLTLNTVSVEDALAPLPREIVHSCNSAKTFTVMFQRHWPNFLLKFSIYKCLNRYLETDYFLWNQMPTAELV